MNSKGNEDEMRMGEGPSSRRVSNNHPIHSQSKHREEDEGVEEANKTNTSPEIRHS